jgi:hypothetical protein
MIDKISVIANPKSVLNNLYNSVSPTCISKNQFKRLLWGWVKEADDKAFAEVYKEKLAQEQKLLAKRAAKLNWHPEKIGRVDIIKNKLVITSIEHPKLSITSNDVLASLRRYQAEHRVIIIDGNIWTTFER